MPRIRPYQQEQSAQGVAPQTRSAIAADFGGATADVMTEFGAQLTKISNHIDNARRDSLLSSNTAKATQEIQEFAFTLKNGTTAEDGTITAPPDPSEHYRLYNEKVKEIGDRYGKNFEKDEALKGLFTRDFGKVAVQQSFGVRTNATERQKEAAVADLNQTEDTLADIYSRGDEFIRKQVVEQYRGQVARFAAAGIISPIDAGKREDKFITMTERATARELIRNDPDKALDAFLSGDQFKRMPADEREKWTQMAVVQSERQRKGALAEQERMRREAERAQKEVEEVTYKDAMDLAVSGKLTARWVQAKRNDISKTDYDNLLKIAVNGGGLKNKGSGEGGRDSASYADLRIRAGKGDDVRSEAVAALASGRITAQQFSGITSEVETNNPGAKTENWYKTGREMITRSLAVSQTNPRLDAAVQARALDDWQQYSAQNPKATPQERDRMRDSIINSSRIIQSDEIVTSIPTPRFLQGQKTTPNMTQTIKRTEEEYAAGRLSKPEFDREMRNIRDLNEWFKREQAKPKSAEKGKK